MGLYSEESRRIGVALCAIVPSRSSMVQHATPTLLSSLERKNPYIPKSLESKNSLEQNETPKKTNE